ncbi:MAG: hypothetical protein Q8942_10175 [Bacillota bacterium]|nr:hypothetical protein [Bacillota bacterium]
MNLTVILIIVFGAIFCIGGPILGHYAAKASENIGKEDINKSKSK